MHPCDYLALANSVVKNEVTALGNSLQGLYGLILESEEMKVDIGKGRRS